jgi:hypothetical protein
MIEGYGVADTENWTVGYTGTSLSTTLTGLTAPKGYRLRVRAKSEHSLLSLYSSIKIYYAAAIPT